MSIRLEVWGDYALFTRPEMKTERVSYDVLTPSAARGILEAIYWHDGLAYHIDRIHVCSPIRFTSIKRNELKSTINARNVKSIMDNGYGELYIDRSTDIMQRSAILLKNVHYVIDAHFDMTAKAAPSDNPGKFYNIIKRRIEKGAFYHQPYFGMREFPVFFSPCETIPPCPDELKGMRDLGYMLWDMNYDQPGNIRPLFFRAMMENGVLRVPTRNSGEVIG